MFKTKKLARAGIISAIYVVLSYVLMGVSSGAIQIRIAEAFCLMPLLYVEAIPAVTVGCLIANVVTGCGVADIVLGTTITLISSLLTYFTGRIIKNISLKIIIGGLFPVVLNALFLPIIWIIFTPNSSFVYLLEVLFLFISQSISIYVFGTLLYLEIKALQKRGIDFLL